MRDQHEHSGAPWIRTFSIDGLDTHVRTHRTGLIEHYTPIRNRTFLDVGASDGYESRAMAIAGAARAVAVEGRDRLYQQAVAARDHLSLSNQEILQLDARRIDTYELGEFDVVLCFGFLYHMENPFNVLKRLRNVTRTLLLLETQVAPRSFVGLLRKHVALLPFDMHLTELDGSVFEGKFVPHREPHALTKSSLDSPWSFWLTQRSLVKAVTRAGFSIFDYHFDIDEGSPEAVQKWGRQLRFGHSNSKVWLAATPVRDSEPVGTATSRPLQGDPNWSDGFWDSMRRRYLARNAPRTPPITR